MLRLSQLMPAELRIRQFIALKQRLAGKVVASQSVTITNVNDGTNGRSVTNVSQKWRLTTTTATPTQAWSDAGWLTTRTNNDSY